MVDHLKDDVNCVGGRCDQYWLALDGHVVFSILSFRVLSYDAARGAASLSIYRYSIVLAHFRQQQEQTKWRRTTRRTRLRTLRH